MLFNDFTRTVLRFVFRGNISLSILFCTAMLMNCNSNKNSQVENSIQQPGTDTTNNIPMALEKGKVHTTSTGLKIELIEVGEGDCPKSGQEVVVHYIGILKGGKEFDNSYKKNQTFSFILGKGQVIAGWDEALLMMRPGDRVRLEVPPSLGYGAQGYPGAIPPDATLIFDVALLELRLGAK